MCTQRPRSLGRHVAVVLLLVVTGAGCGRQATQTSQSSPVQLAAEEAPAVDLVIDYGDGVEKRFKQIPHQEKMTVMGALRFAERHPRGIRFEVEGAGEAALLTKIDDLANQGGGDGKNWLYRVNGQPGTKSFDAYVLAPGDVILWRFEKYE